MGFTFKQFHIEQDNCAMKVGTDGVLLGAWARGGKRILDIGTGTGLIALMMAQRFPYASIDAIEIDGAASEEARKNIENSPFKDRITIFNTSLQEFHRKQSEYNLSGMYNTIVSNPPYFIDSLKNIEQNKTIARHTETLSFNELIRCSHGLLKTNGNLSVIIPTESQKFLENEAIFVGLSCSERVYIKTKEHKEAKRVLLEFRNGCEACNTTTESLTDEENNKTDWYYNITKDFYIK